MQYGRWMRKIVPTFAQMEKNIQRKKQCYIFDVNFSRNKIQDENKNQNSIKSAPKQAFNVIYSLRRFFFHPWVLALCSIVSFFVHAQRWSVAITFFNQFHCQIVRIFFIWWIYGFGRRFICFRNLFPIRIFPSKGKKY